MVHAHSGRKPVSFYLVAFVGLCVVAAAKPEEFPPPPDVAGPPADSKKTASGLAYRVLSPGTGQQRPTVEDTVEVHYTGWSTDGRMFDSSVKRGAPVRFQVTGVIKGWTEALQAMAVGERRRLWVPAHLAYGASASEGRPGGMLVFDIELLGITGQPRAPEDVAGPPKTARKTKTGLAYRVLQRGKGKRHPKPEDTVEVHYTGWTPDGKMFDNSVGRLEPPRFLVSGAIPGWTEGLQLMVVGDKIRFWIPAKLAYGASPNTDRPKGTVVFDLELLSIR
jgi:FKBP-type peptidyl-prolyl cis-trans isomerase